MKMKVLVAAVALVPLAAVPAMAQNSYYNYTTVRGYVPYSPWAPGAQGPSAQQWTQQEYGYSGTLGRQGLGASPYHPEGPGNAVSPR